MESCLTHVQVCGRKTSCCYWLIFLGICQPLCLPGYPGFSLLWCDCPQGPAAHKIISPAWTAAWHCHGTFLGTYKTSPRWHQEVTVLLETTFSTMLCLTNSYLFHRQFIAIITSFGEYLEFCETSGVLFFRVTTICKHF